MPFVLPTSLSWIRMVLAVWRIAAYGRQGRVWGNTDDETGELICYPAAMQCLANITQSLQDLVSPHMGYILGPLFSNGLSDEVGV